MVAVDVHGVGKRRAIVEREHHHAPPLDGEQGRPVVSGGGKASERPDPRARVDPMAGNVAAAHPRRHERAHHPAIERCVYSQRPFEVEPFRQRIGRQRRRLREPLRPGRLGALVGEAAERHVAGSILDHDGRARAGFEGWHR